MYHDWCVHRCWLSFPFRIDSVCEIVFEQLALFQKAGRDSPCGAYMIIHDESVQLWNALPTKIYGSPYFNVGITFQRDTHFSYYITTLLTTTHYTTTTISMGMKLLQLKAVKLNYRLHKLRPCIAMMQSLKDFFLNDHCNKNS